MAKPDPKMSMSSVTVCGVCGKPAALACGTCMQTFWCRGESCISTACKSCPPLAASGHTAEHMVAESDTLYHRLGGIFGIAMLIKYFSDLILAHPRVGLNSPNPQLRAWAEKPNFTMRYAGLVFQREAWLNEVAGGPYKFVPTQTPGEGESTLDLTRAHFCLRITDEEFDIVAGLLKQTLKHFSTPEYLRHLTPADHKAVLDAFGAHKAEVIRGHTDPDSMPELAAECPHPEVRMRMLAMSSGKKGFGYVAGEGR